jgi:hypothetical protein
MFVLFWASLGRAEGTDFNCAINPSCKVFLIQPRAESIAQLNQMNPDTLGDQLARDIHHARQFVSVYGVKSWLTHSFGYKALNFFVMFDQFDKGSELYLNSVSDNFVVLDDFLRSGARLKYIRGVGMIPVGGDFSILLRLNVRDYVEGRARMALFAITLIPGVELAEGLVTGAFNAVRLWWLKPAVEALADGAKVHIINRRILSAQIEKMGEAELAEQVYRHSRLTSIQDFINLAIRKNVWKVGKWAGLTTIANVSGFAFPARPSSLSPYELTRFAATQGALILSGDNTNVTTRAIEMTGVKAIRFLTSIVSRWASVHPDGTTEQFIRESFVTSPSETKKSIPTQEARELSDGEIQGKLRIKYDTTYRSYVISLG